MRILRADALGCAPIARRWFIVNERAKPFQALQLLLVVSKPRCVDLLITIIGAIPFAAQLFSMPKLIWLYTAWAKNRCLKLPSACERANQSTICAACVAPFICLVLAKRFP